MRLSQARNARLLIRQLKTFLIATLSASAMRISVSAICKTVKLLCFSTLYAPAGIRSWKMKTVNETLLLLSSRARMQRVALQALVNQGFGEGYCVTYGGTPYATHGSSNAAKTREYFRARGYVVLAEMAGPRRRYRSEGNLVFMVIGAAA
jgi:hypothetical protein